MRKTARRPKLIHGNGKHQQEKHRHESEAVEFEELEPTRQQRNEDDQDEGDSSLEGSGLAIGPLTVDHNDEQILSEQSPATVGMHSIKQALASLASTRALSGQEDKQEEEYFDQLT